MGFQQREVYGSSAESFTDFQQRKDYWFSAERTMSFQQREGYGFSADRTSISASVELRHGERFSLPSQD